MTRSVFERFKAAVAIHGDRPFLHAPAETAAIYHLDQTDFTYAEAAAAVDALAGAYAKAGVASGACVALAFDNRPEFFLHLLAVNARNASIMPLNMAMQTDELAHQIVHSEADLIVAAPTHVKRLQEISALTPRRPPACNGKAIAGERAAVREAVSNGAPGKPPAAILYTSGTTGQPKGCVLSNEYFLQIGAHYAAIGGAIEFSPGRERIMTPLPVTHMNALACSFMVAIETGACLIQLDRFHPKTWWETVRQSRTTIMHYLGVMPAMLLNAPETPDDHLGGRIRFAFGAGCDPRHHQRFEERFGVRLIEAWAMTETGAGAWITAAHEPRHVGTRCFGRAPAGLETRIVDEEGRDVAPGVDGELLVRRAGQDPRRYFFGKYFKDEAATEEAWRGGWFHTGDAVRQDADGYFYFVDRLKNVIRRSGENIAAIEVEGVLQRAPGIAAVVVVPVPDEVRGDEVMALIVAKGAANEEAARRIFAFAMENLVYFKAPGYIAFIDAAPMTASEKIRRGEAKAIGRRLVAEGRAFDFRSLKMRRAAAQ